MRSFTFFHSRFIFSLFLGAFVSLAAISCVTTPRTITVECEPETGPVVRCVSTARSFWNSAEPWKSRIAATPPQGLDALEIDLAYTKTRWKLESDEILKGRFRPQHDEGDWTRDSGWAGIAGPYPSSTDSVSELLSFTDRLKAGHRAFLVYRSGWGGLLIAVPVTLYVILCLWLLSGRSTLVHYVGEGIIESRSRRFWHSRARRKRLACNEIDDAIVTATYPNKVLRHDEAPLVHQPRAVYRPALRLQNGEIVEFPILGGRTPARARHLADQIRRFLDLPDGPLRTMERRVP